MTSIPLRSGFYPAKSGDYRVLAIYPTLGCCHSDLG